MAALTQLNTCNPVNPEPKATRHNQDARKSIMLDLGEVFIGDIGLADVRDMAEEGLPSTLELRTARYQHNRAQGLVELKLGAHTYLVNARQIAEALAELEA